MYSYFVTVLEANPSGAFQMIVIPLLALCNFDHNYSCLVISANSPIQSLIKLIIWLIIDFSLLFYNMEYISFLF